MHLASLLVLTTLLALPSNASAQTAPNASAAPALLASNISADNVANAQSFRLAPEQVNDRNALASPDDVCYRIRAYIFRRDDDHTPKLIGSTTCGPRKAHTKVIMEPNGEPHSAR